jgi:uncharacterized membrane protein YkvA (DUF1232 family)
MAKFLRRFKFLFNVRKSIPFLVDFFTSKNVSIVKKVLSIGIIVGYFFLPLDLIPDFLVIFGIVDDIAVFSLVLQSIVKMAPQELKDQYDIKNLS